MPHVDVAVGVRGAVMQDPPLAAGARLAELRIEPLRIPLAKQLRLPHRQIGLHGKAGLGEIQR